MQCLRRFLVLFVGLGLLASPALAEDQPLQMPPLSAYGELPQIEDASISPSGNRIAALLTVNGNRMLALFESGTKLINRVSVNDFKIRSIDWIGEDRVLVIYSETEKLGAFFTTDKHEFYKALILSTNPNSQAEVVFTNKRYLANAVLGSTESVTLVANGTASLVRLNTSGMAICATISSMAGLTFTA